MVAKNRPKRRTPKVGERIARAWLDTVINPLLQALKWEEMRLEEHDWTWQYRPGRLESIRGVEEMIAPLAVDNLEQFLSLYPIRSVIRTLKENIGFHDEERSQLFVACKKLQCLIEESGGLREIYERVTSQPSLSELGANLAGLFGTLQAKEHLWTLAQYIVNNTGDIPSYYPIAPLWNKHRDEFLALLNQPAIIDHSRRTTQAGEKLLKTAQHLMDLLKETREQLSLAYDLPYVTSATIYAE